MIKERMALVQKMVGKHRLRADQARSLGFIWIILIPMLVQYTITTAVPMIMSFVLTFTNWSLMGTHKFIGLANWQKMLADPEVWNSLKVTLLYALYVVIPTVIIGLGLALLINNYRPGVGFFKAAYFFPVITSTVVIASIWKWMFVADESGIINQLLAIFGISPKFFFGTDLALFTVALLGIFQSVGTTMVYFYAGLKGIPHDIIEAAKVDGCTGLQSFWHVTLPMLKPTMAYVLIIMTSTAMKVFDSIYMLYNQTGGPQNVANSLVMNVWRTSFLSMQMGYGSTIAYVLFFLILLVSIAQYAFTSRDNTN